MRETEILPRAQFESRSISSRAISMNPSVLWPSLPNWMFRPDRSYWLAQFRSRGYFLETSSLTSRSSLGLSTYVSLLREVVYATCIGFLDQGWNMAFCTTSCSGQLRRNAGQGVYKLMNLETVRIQDDLFLLPNLFLNRVEFCLQLVYERACEEITYLEGAGSRFLDLN